MGATVLCPGTVRTNIHTSSRNRPTRAGSSGLADIDISERSNQAYRWIDPAEERRHEAIADAFLTPTDHPDRPAGSRRGSPLVASAPAAVAGRTDAVLSDASAPAAVAGRTDAVLSEVFDR